MGRYVIRVFADRDQNNVTDQGTLVEPLVLQVSFCADTAEEAEKRLIREVAHGKLSKGRVYQICPSMGSFEPIRSCAIGLDGSSTRVFLDPAEGLYGSLRRIRLPRPCLVEQPEQEPVTVA